MHLLVNPAAIKYRERECLMINYCNKYTVALNAMQPEMDVNYRDLQAIRQVSHSGTCY